METSYNLIAHYYDGESSHMGAFRTEAAALAEAERWLTSPEYNDIANFEIRVRYSRAGYTHFTA